ncbi:MAG: tetratricopeptide repeat protein, partial [Nocardioidaceae bacterium]
MHAADALERGRESYLRRAWRDAYDELTAADEQAALDAVDLDRLGMAGYLIGLDDAAVAGLERAHHAFLADGEVGPAARCAFWVGMILFLRGRHAEGGGWLGRAQHVLEEDAQARVERGYLVIPAALQTLDGGDPDAAYRMFGEIADIADGFDAPDLVALSRLGRGQALVAMGDVTRGVAMLDEAMVSVTTGDVSPIAAGIVYCALIIACRQIFDLRRAQEWTVALSRWCATQQDLRPYRGQCLVHRSEIMQLRGDWADAMDEVREACAHLAQSPGDPVLGMAHYQLGELLRLRGQFDRAEQAYRKAGESGHAVQPGLALLRLAQGRVADATAAVRRVVDEAEDDRVKRSRVLAAYVEIVLADGDVDAAREVAEELSELSDAFEAPYLR